MLRDIFPSPKLGIPIWYGTMMRSIETLLRSRAILVIAFFAALALVAVALPGPVAAQTVSDGARKSAAKESPRAKSLRARAVKSTRTQPVAVVATRRVVDVPARPSVGQLNGLHAVDDPLDLKSSVALVVDQPQAPREIIQHWPDDKVFFFRMLDPSDDYSNRFLPLAYGWLNEKMNWSIGTTILNGRNIVNTMIPMTHSFGYSPVFMCGYDLGYPDNKRRCSDYRLENGEWKIIPAPELTPQR